MSAANVPQAVSVTDYHTAGEPFRIVTAGVPEIAGETVLGRRAFARREPLVRTELDRNAAHVLDGSRATHATVAHECDGLAIPFDVSAIQRVLEHGSGTMVVLCHCRNERITAPDPVPPHFCSGLRVHPVRDRGTLRFGKERKISFAQIQHFEFEVAAGRSSL